MLRVACSQIPETFLIRPDRAPFLCFTMSLSSPCRSNLHQRRLLPLKHDLWNYIKYRKNCHLVLAILACPDGIIVTVQPDRRMAELLRIIWSSSSVSLSKMTFTNRLFCSICRISTFNDVSTLIRHSEGHI